MADTEDESRGVRAAGRGDIEGNPGGVRRVRWQAWLCLSLSALIGVFQLFLGNWGQGLGIIAWDAFVLWAILRKLV